MRGVIVAKSSPVLQICNGNCCCLRMSLTEAETDGTKVAAEVRHIKTLFLALVHHAVTNKVIQRKQTDDIRFTFLKSIVIRPDRCIHSHSLLRSHLHRTRSYGVTDLVHQNPL